MKKWNGKYNFINKLRFVERYLRHKNKLKSKNIKCEKCKHNISYFDYELNDYKWNGILRHDIKNHEYKPKKDFIKMIMLFSPVKINNKKHKVKLNSKTYVMGKLEYVKFSKNQIMIIDALMRHGGYSKRYYDKKDNIYRYSEHHGLIEFNERGMEKIIVSPNTKRIDMFDDSIFLPINMPDAEQYEVVFHTHPASPTPGGRAINGILYELPSLGDLFHFIDHFNMGITQSSIIITPEGMYNIRKNDLTLDKIKINENDFENDYMKIHNKVQDMAIKKYGINFSAYTFYSKIAQETTYIDMINQVINKYNINIDYFPRTKDSKGHWIIDTVYIPLRIITTA